MFSLPSASLDLKVPNNNNNDDGDEFDDNDNFSATLIDLSISLSYV